MNKIEKNIAEALKMLVEAAAESQKLSKDKVENREPNLRNCPNLTSRPRAVPRELRTKTGKKSFNAFPSTMLK